MKTVASTSVLCLLAFTGTFSAVSGFIDAQLPPPAPRPRTEVPEMVQPERERSERGPSVSWTKPITVSVPRPTGKKVECRVRDLVQGSGTVKVCEGVSR